MDSVREDLLKDRPPFIPGTHDDLDAVAAAPKNHEVLFENDLVRIIRVVVRPGELEEMHTHQWPGVFLINSLAKTEYHKEDGEIVPRVGPPGHDGMMIWVEPEGIHQVKNVDTRLMDGIRFEMKQKR